MEPDREPPSEAQALSRELRDFAPHQMLDSLIEGFQVIGFDWTYLYVNEAAAHQGRSTPAQLRGRTMMEAYPGIESTPMFELLRDCMTHRRSHSMENLFSFPDGTERWFELRFEPAEDGVQIFSLDIETRRRAAQERARLEEQLRQAQKMEAIGRMAGGVAHDFNNLLSIVLSYAQCALDSVPREHRVHADLIEIRSAATRAATLARQLLSVGRREAVEPVLLDLNERVRRNANVIERLAGSAIEVELRLAPDLGLVRVDPEQLERVLLNLVVNARDAMPNGGVLTVETSNVEPNASPERELQTPDGQFVALRVSDTGIGMTSQVRARLFEPFFTTKPEGQGSGMGLAVVYGIVQQAGGQIRVRSEPGSGASFLIHLPRAAGVAHVATR